ncbi:TonB-dependent receptor [Dyella sp. C9]|uniref:TonB-dependent siderophore receptor n=1 Tax=Dyella sp. C9 TaxID=2202154 RepID=UPI000DEF7D60|nr:TonB-dependent receptor [Dyella sp. C9]
MSFDHSITLPHRALSRHLRGILCGCLIAMPLLNSVHAQDLVASSAPAARRVDIAAGPLPLVLSQFAGTQGVTLSFDAAQLGSATSNGLHGVYTAQQGFDALLAGSGWQATVDRRGIYSLVHASQSTAGARAAAPAAATQAGSAPGTTTLSTIQVTAESQNATTEGSGSYTTRALTLGKGEYSMREIPQSVSVITRQRMDDQNINDIKDAMTQTTGVTVQGNANPYLNNSYYARGYALEAELDGIPSSGSLNVGAPQFDMSMYDRIEIIRGSAGLLEGSGEPGGLVNFARKRPTADTQVSGSLSVGSWNQFHGDLDVSGSLNQDKTLQGRMVIADTDNDEFYDHSHHESRMLYGIVEYHLGASTLLSLSGTVQHDETHGILSAIPAYSTGQLLDLSPSTNPFPDWTRSNQNTREAFAELDHFFDGGWRMRASARYRSSDTDARYIGLPGPVDAETGEVQYFPAADNTRFSWISADANASGPFELFGRTHQLMVGMNYDEVKTQDQYSNEPWGSTDFFQLVQLPQPSIPLVGNYQTRTEQYGIYGQARFSITDPFTFVLGGRVSNYHSFSGNADYGTTPDMPRDPGGVDHKFTPYAGLIYTLNSQISLYGSYSQIFVPQSELTASGSPLPPRTGDQYEIGAKGEFYDGKLNASMALFNLKDRNRAYYSSDIFFYSAAGEVRMNGAEAEIGGSPMPGWDLSAGYTYLDPHYRTEQDEANLSAITPRHNAKIWSNYHFQGEALRKFNIGAGLLASSGWTSGNVHAPGYATASLQVGYRIDPHWNVTATIDNALDRRYYQSFYAAGGFYGAPRSFMLTVRAKY